MHKIAHLPFMKMLINLDPLGSVQRSFFTTNQKDQQQSKIAHPPALKYTFIRTRINTAFSASLKRLVESNRLAEKTTSRSLVIAYLTPGLKGI